MSRAKGFTFRPRGGEHIELFRAGRVAGSMDLIYWHPLALTRHRDAPLFKEREEFLLHLLRRGSNRITVQYVGAMLLRAIDALGLKLLRPLSLKDVDYATQQIWGQSVKRGSSVPGFHSAHQRRTNGGNETSQSRTANRAKAHGVTSPQRAFV
jgi:hypothetical protein